MNKYVKEFLKRGLMFSGFGPIIAGIVFAILSQTVQNFALSGTQVFWAIISTYILAFVQAGASVFNQIESWPTMKSLLFHFLTIYATYVGCYILNSWIPFDINVILIFTLIFAVCYFVIWFIVYFCVKGAEKKLNRSLKGRV